MAPSSSASKVARLATRGKGKKVRFQGGTLFPAVVAAVVVIMLALVVYARASRPTDGAGPPRLGDHWHAAYGIYVCDEFEPKLLGTREEQVINQSTGQTELADRHFRLYGIHSHDDGVIHYHPYSGRATGTRARLGVFLDAYDVELSDTVLELPEDQGGLKWDTDDFKCGDKDAQLKVRVWNSYANPGDYSDYVTDFKSIRIDRNGMVFTIAVVPKDADIPQPPWAAQLPELGAVDGGTAISVPEGAGDDTTPGTGAVGTTPGTGGTDTSEVPATTVAADATVPGTDAAATTAVGTSVATTGSPATGG